VNLFFNDFGMTHILHETYIQIVNVIQITHGKNIMWRRICLRKILNIHWPEVISNEELWRRTEKTEISIQIKRRKWNWIGHTLREGNEAIEREALDWNPQGKRRKET